MPEIRKYLRGSQALVAFAAVPVVGMLLTALLFAGASRENQMVQNTLRVKQKLSMLESAVQDIQLNKRGYIITADKRYLVPFREAKDETAKLQADLVELVAEERDQSKRIKGLENNITAIISSAQRAVDLVRSGDREAAIQLTEASRGDDLMAKFRYEIQEAWVEEDSVFASRKEAYAKNWRWLVGSLAMTLVASIGVAYLLHLREFERRRASEARAARLASDALILEERVAERTADLARERDRAEALLRDVTHRIGNMLSLVVGFLNLHMRHASSPEAQRILSSARDRVMAISSAQRRMNVVNDLEMVRLDSLIQGVVDDVSEAQPADNVEVVVDIAPLLASARDITTISVLVQEFYVNALKHAFPDGRSGTITIRFERIAGGGGQLIVRDDGIGMAAAKSNEQQNGSHGNRLGSQITERLAAQFGGEITYSSETGTTVTVTMPNVKIEDVTTAALSDEAKGAAPSVAANP